MLIVVGYGLLLFVVACGCVAVLVAVGGLLVWFADVRCCILLVAGVCCCFGVVCCCLLFYGMHRCVLLFVVYWCWSLC